MKIRALSELRVGKEIIRAGAVGVSDGRRVAFLGADVSNVPCNEYPVYDVGILDKLDFIVE